MTVQILCRSPGMRRCGVEHPAKKTYPAGRWTADELDTIRADPAFEVIESGDGAAESGGSVPRSEAVRAAVGTLKEDEFTQGGRPKVAVLERKLGFKPTADEIDAAMAAAVNAADATPAEAGETASAEGASQTDGETDTATKSGA